MSKEDILKLIKTAIYDKNSIIEANRAKYKMIKEEPQKTIETKFIIRLIISITLLIVITTSLFLIYTLVNIISIMGSYKLMIFRLIIIKIYL